VFDWQKGLLSEITNNILDAFLNHDLIINKIILMMKNIWKARANFFTNH